MKFRYYLFSGFVSVLVSVIALIYLVYNDINLYVMGSSLFAVITFIMVISELRREEDLKEIKCLKDTQEFLIRALIKEGILVSKIEKMKGEEVKKYLKRKK